jgi:hypothetical protein
MVSRKKIYSNILTGLPGDRIGDKPRIHVRLPSSEAKEFNDSLAAIARHLRFDDSAGTGYSRLSLVYRLGAAFAAHNPQLALAFKKADCKRKESEKQIAMTSYGKRKLDEISRVKHIACDVLVRGSLCWLVKEFTEYKREFDLLNKLANKDEDAEEYQRNKHPNSRQARAERSIRARQKLLSEMREAQRNHKQNDPAGYRKLFVEWHRLEGEVQSFLGPDLPDDPDTQEILRNNRPTLRQESWYWQRREFFRRLRFWERDPMKLITTDNKFFNTQTEAIKFFEERPDKHPVPAPQARLSASQIAVKQSEVLIWPGRWYWLNIDSPYRPFDVEGRPFLWSDISIDDLFHLTPEDETD